MQSSPPANAGYMIAAYLVTAIIVLWYAAALLLKARRALRHRDQPGGEPARRAAG